MQKAIKMGYKKATHVIFDLDGLLLDTESIYKPIFRDIAKQHGKLYSSDIFSKVIGRSDLDCAEYVVKEMKLSLSPQEYLKQLKCMAQQALAKVGFIPGAENLVRHFHSKHVPIAVATSSSQDSFDLKTARHKELFSLFHHIVTGGSDPEVKHGKPSPDIFLVCASRFGDNPKPEQCLVLEDAPSGVEAALGAGMQVVMVPDKETAADLCQKATLKLASLKEMKPELFGLPAL